MLSAAFTPGESKRAAKFQHNGDLGYKIYSCAHKDSLHEIAEDLCNCIKESGRKCLRDITQEDFQHWLNENPNQKSKIIPITSKVNQDILKKIIVNRDNENDIVHNSKSFLNRLEKDSINRAITRARDKLNHIEYTGNHMHAICKTWTLERNNEYRREHTKAESIAYVNTILGHGEKRSVAELLHYVSNIV